MTTGLVSQHQLSAVTDPVNNKTIIQAADVRNAANAVGTGYNTHDADASIHFQSSTLAARPDAATAGAGTKWITSDGLRVYYSDGATWSEAQYLSLAAGGTVAAAVTVTQLSLSAAVSKIIPGATSLSLRNNADSADNLIITNAGAATFRTSVNVTTFLQAAGGNLAGSPNIRLLGATTGFYQATADNGIGCAGSVDSFQWDSNNSAGNTRFLIYAVTGGQFYRIQTGANGTGPGGTGRALYINDA